MPCQAHAAVKAVVNYGLLCVLAAQEVGIQSQPPCSVEKFGIDDHCNDCETFHAQMLEDGVNLTARCGWSPEGSDQRPPSEFANRMFSVGERPACESCNEFYQRLFNGFPPFNLTEKCRWQIAESIRDESSPPTTMASHIGDSERFIYIGLLAVSVIINGVLSIVLCIVLYKRKRNATGKESASNNSHSDTQVSTESSEADPLQKDFQNASRIESSFSTPQMPDRSTQYARRRLNSKE